METELKVVATQIDVIKTATEILQNRRRGATNVSVRETVALAAAVVDFHSVLIAADELVNAYEEKELAVIKTPGLDGRLISATADLKLSVTALKAHRGFVPPTQEANQNAN